MGSFFCRGKFACRCGLSCSFLWINGSATPADRQISYVATLDFTTKSLPRYLLIVLAFAGDSTMTSDLLIESIYPILANIPASEFFGQLPY